MKKIKLNGWQRIGIILSVLLVLFSTFYVLKKYGDSYGYLQKYADNDGIENILTDSKLRPRLKKMMGNGFPELEKRLKMSDGHVVDDYIIMTGQMQHSGGNDEACLAIALDGSHIYAAFLKTDYTTKNVKRTIRIYSDKPAMRSNIPKEMEDWVSQYKNTTTQWKYAK